MLALYGLGETITIPALISALSDNHREVRQIAAAGLVRLGGSQTLPLRVLPAQSLTPAEKLNTLEQMRRVRYRDEGFTLNFSLSAIADYCRAHIGDGNGDANVRDSAAAVLAEIENLTQSNSLVRASDVNPAPEGSQLLRAVSTGAVTIPVDQQLRASDAPPEASQPSIRRVAARIVDE